MKKKLYFSIYKLCLLLAAAPYAPIWILYVAEANLVFLYIKKLIVFYKHRKRSQSLSYRCCLLMMGGLSALALIAVTLLSRINEYYSVGYIADLIHYLPGFTLALSFGKLVFFIRDRSCRIEMCCLLALYTTFVLVHFFYFIDMAYLLWSLSILNTCVLIFNQYWHMHQDFNRVNEIDIYQEVLIGLHFY